MLHRLDPLHELLAVELHPLQLHVRHELLHLREDRGRELVAQRRQQQGQLGAGLPGQPPHTRWAAVDKGLGRPARDALAVSDDDALQEGFVLAVAAIDVDLEQVLEDPTVVRDDLGSVKCQGIVVTVGTVLEEEDLGAFEGDEIVLRTYLPTRTPGMHFLHSLLFRCIPSP